MPRLILTHPEARAARRHPKIIGKPVMARGHFCAVFDNGDTVLKLTRDPIQYGYSTDYCRPIGPHFPTLVDDFGVVGEVQGDPLYLFEVEKLTPFRRSTPAHLKRRAKQLMDTVESTTTKHIRGYGRRQVRCAYMAALEEMATLDIFGESLQEALSDLATFVSNYDEASADFHSANLMLRGDALIFNDVFCTYNT